jgi:hypothetical protein
MTLRALALGMFVVGLSASTQARVATQWLPRDTNSRPLPGPGAQLNSFAGTQAPAAAENGKISVEGCVERAQRNGSVGGTGLGTTSSPNTAARDANSSETLDVFQLSNAQPQPGDAASTGRTTYALDGQEQELGKHTGHRVQVTGMLAPPRAAATSTAAATAAGIRRIRVDAIKMVSSTCGNPVK